MHDRVLVIRIERSGGHGMRQATQGVGGEGERSGRGFVTGVCFILRGLFAPIGNLPHSGPMLQYGFPPMDSLKALIREVADFPKPGINFYDITTLLKDANGFKKVIDSLAEQYKSTAIDVVLGIEARGFIIAPAVAYALGYGFIPVRKQKKLPAERARIEYQLEYGTDVLEIHKDAVSPGQNVLIIDDVLATGGTAAAVAKLVETLEGKVAGLGFILELDFLKGREKLAGYPVHSLVHY